MNKKQAKAAVRTAFQVWKDAYISYANAREALREADAAYKKAYTALQKVE